MTTKETLGRRILALEHRRPRPRDVKDVSDDELMSIIMGRPCRAADITDEELKEIIDALDISP